MDMGTFAAQKLEIGPKNALKLEKKNRQIAMPPPPNSF